MGVRCPQTLGIRGFEPFQWYGTVLERTGTVGKSQVVYRETPTPQPADTLTRMEDNQHA